MAGFDDFSADMQGHQVLGAVWARLAQRERALLWSYISKLLARDAAKASKALSAQRRNNQALKKYIGHLHGLLGMSKEGLVVQLDNGLEIEERR